MNCLRNPNIGYSLVHPDLKRIVMNLLEEVQGLLTKYGIHPKKKWGQHFCVDHDLLKKMIHYAQITKEDVVLDIGAGFGFLTKLLLKRAKKVIAVESDTKLINALEMEMNSKNNVSIIRGSILKTLLPYFNKIVANPPYSISSQLIHFLVKTPFKRAILTLQREFAEKLISQKGEENYSNISVVMSYKFTVKLRDKVLQTAFFPIPAVDSIVVQIDSDIPHFTITNEQFFFNFVKTIFTLRRKKLKNALTSFIRNNNYVLQKKKGLKTLPFLDSRVNKLSPLELSIVSNQLSHLIKSGNL